MDARVDHRLVDARHAFQRLRILARDDLDDFLERVELVARVDPLGRITEFEISGLTQARGFCQERPALLLGHAGINRRFVYDHGPRSERGGHQSRRGQKRPEVRPPIGIDRGRYRNHEEGAASQIRCIAGELQAGFAQLGLGHLAGPIVPIGKRFDSLLGDVEANRILELSGKRQRHRKTHVPEPQDCNALAHRGWT